MNENDFQYHHKYLDINARSDSLKALEADIDVLEASSVICYGKWNREMISVLDNGGGTGIKCNC